MGDELMIVIVISVLVINFIPTKEEREGFKNLFKHKKISKHLTNRSGVKGG